MGILIGKTVTKMMKLIYIKAINPLVLRKTSFIIYHRFLEIILFNFYLLIDRETN
jgi:hypothetical protein